MEIKKLKKQYKAILFLNISSMGKNKQWSKPEALESEMLQLNKNDAAPSGSDTLKGP
jgi:hypothetical protein